MRAGVTREFAQTSAGVVRARLRHWSVGRRVLSTHRNPGNHRDHDVKCA